jgi:uncharacterized MAPEG superfamily protein
MDIFDVYSHALASLACFAILISVLGGLSAGGGSPENRCECGQPKRDYDNVVYRRNRAFMNAVESAGPFIAALMAAILTGGSPLWVNIFASVFLLARVATAVVHIGTINEGLRSATWFVGLLCVFGLAIMGIWGAF